MLHYNTKTKKPYVRTWLELDLLKVNLDLLQKLNLEFLPKAKSRSFYKLNQTKI